MCMHVCGWVEGLFMNISCMWGLGVDKNVQVVGLCVNMGGRGKCECG